MSAAIRAKFFVTEVKEHGENVQVSLSAVTDGSEENKSFSKYTPSGTCSLFIDNPEVTGFFVEGQSYYLDFTPAEK